MRKIEALPLNEAAIKSTEARWNSVAKPVGSLGELESLLIKIAAVSGSTDISKRAVIILAADNGVTAQGIASTPPEITVTMSEFMAKHRSSVCIMAKTANCDAILRDMGMFRLGAGVEGPHISDGTADMSQQAAMTVEQCEQAIEYGIELVKTAKEQGYKLLATGEMGIGNTSTSSAIAAVLLNRSVEEITGRGAGLDDEGFKRKIEVIKKSIEINKPDANDAFDVLRKLGGYDIAGLCGVFLGGAVCGIPIIIDGFISGIAALCAARICPEAVQAMIASHVSAEPAAIMVLEELGLKPIIHAGMRLGEGTGAVALIPMLDMVKAVFDEMMTFADIGM